MKSIVRHDTGKDWREYATGLTGEEGKPAEDEMPAVTSCATSIIAARKKSVTTCGRAIPSLKPVSRSSRTATRMSTVTRALTV